MTLVSRSRGRGQARRPQGAERPPRTRQRPASDHAVSDEAQSDAGAADIAVRLWASTRHGATAGRGFHYQDAVVAWLAARMLTGDLQLERLIPEGIEDISCEGPHATQVQVKSRQARVGDYRLSEVAQFLLEMHRKHSDGPTSRDRLHLVLERPVEGHSPDIWEGRLADDPAGLISSAVRRLATQRDTLVAEDFFARTTVFVLPWRAAADQTRKVLESVEGVSPAVAEQVVLALRSMMTAVQDDNVTPDVRQRRSVNGALLRRAISEALSIIDVESLSIALRSGVCEVLDLDTQTATDAFYEGIEAQPGHIAAGLPAPRATETSAAAEALESGKPVLITGPSGVGKSTIMWATAYAMRHTLWYRVRRLSDVADVEALARLASSCRASEATPVGFVVDGVGVEGIGAWDSLITRVQGQPFVYLIGSCRSEDLYNVQRLASCAQVDVALDESTAEGIYDHLSVAGRTAAAHWLEAFKASRGLTLEYTFLLTQGRRLSEVIHDQVSRRIRENRSLELEIIALVSSAHRWNATLPLPGVIRALRAERGEVRQALSRLLSEHLVVEVDGQLSGLHELRSRELSKQVHQTPPPTLIETAATVISTVDSANVFRTVFFSLVDDPELDEPILAALVNRIRATPEDGASALEALRTVDFQRVATEWTSILEDNSVAPALRSICVSLALVEREHDYSLFKPEVARAIPLLRRADPRAFRLRDALLTRLGHVQLREMLLGQPGITALSNLLASLVGTEHDLVAILRSADPARFLLMIESSTLEQLADLFANARAVDLRLAQYFVEFSERDVAIHTRLLHWSPWLTGARLRQEGGNFTAELRMLHVSDEFTPDLHRKSVEIASLALRCMPEAQAADVQILLAGGYVIRIGDHTSGQSKLDRSYDHTTAQIRWNRRRAAVIGQTLALLGQTRRLATAVPLLDDLSAYLDGLVRRFASGRFRSGEQQSLMRLNRAIKERADSLVMPIEDPIAVEERAAAGIPTQTLDHLHTLADGIVDNLTGRLLAAQPNWPPLCGYVGDTLLSASAACEEEEAWELLGYDKPPRSLVTLRLALDNLRIVLAELAFGELSLNELSYWSRVGRGESLGSQLARRAEARAVRRGEGLRLKLEGALAARGVSCAVHSRGFKNEDAVFWPQLQLGVVVQCQDILGWSELLAVVVDEVVAQDSEWGARLRTLVVPKIGTRIVRQLSCGVTFSALPDVELLDSWQQLLADVAATPLHDSMTSAILALQAVSAVVELSTIRDLQPAVAEYVETMVTQYSGAVETIKALSDDDACILALLDYLDELQQRVQTEIDSGTSAIPSLAARIAAGAVGEEVTEEYTVQVYAMSLALQWDLDPELANGVLGELEGGGD